MERLALIDGDEIAYKGAFSCQYNRYDVIREDKSILCSTRTRMDAIEFIEDDYSLGIKKRAVPEDIILGYKRIDNLLSSILFNTKSYDYKLFLTGDSNFRDGVSTILPYKGNRKEREAPIHLNSMKEYLREKEAETYEYLEADDCLSASQNLITDRETVICSQDKDLKTVKGFNYNITSKTLTYIEERDARYNFYFQLLIGDPVDNIPHPRGIGNKFAENRLRPLFLEDATEEDYYKECVSAYNERLNESTRWWKDDMKVDDILLEIGNLIYLHKTFDEKERWVLPK